MALSDRMRVVINESGLNQKDFAKSINVTDSYISKLLRDESGMANSMALLIEQLYGYSKEWILKGKDPKMLTGRGHKMIGLQKKIISDVEQMNEGELLALSAFIDSLKNSVVRPYRERKAK
jgi:transcriptional regulator with XRE-family HTH domain